MIAVTTLDILSDTVTGIHAWVIFALALLAFFESQAKWMDAAITLGAGLYGLLFLRGEFHDF